VLSICLLQRHSKFKHMQNLGHEAMQPGRSSSMFRRKGHHLLSAFWFLLGLLFHLEDGGNVFPWNAAGMSSGLRKMKNCTLWRGRPPPEQNIKDWALWRGRPTPKRDETPTSSVGVRRARYVGAPATPGVMAHRGKEKTRKTFGCRWEPQLTGTL
jgi:hypothetical protein